MRLYASNELKSRLTHAAANGSVIAADILSELKKNRRRRLSADHIISCPPNGSGRTVAPSGKSGLCSPPSTRTRNIPISRTGTTRRHPGSLKTGQTWNHPPSSNSSRTYANTHPAKSIISAVPSRSTAKFPSGCIQE